MSFRLDLFLCNVIFILNLFSTTTTKNNKKFLLCFAINRFLDLFILFRKKMNKNKKSVQICTKQKQNKNQLKILNANQ